MAVSDAELKVALASVDADGSGDVSFSEFYAWFAGNGAGDDVGSLDDDMMSVADTRSELSGFSAASPGRLSAVGASRGLRNAARTTFVKVCRHGIRWLDSRLARLARQHARTRVAVLREVLSFLTYLREFCKRDQALSLLSTFCQKKGLPGTRNHEMMASSG